MVSDLDRAIGKGINLSLLKLGIPVLCQVIEEGSSNLGPEGIHELNVQQDAGRLSILPGFECVFLSEARFDLPLLSKSVERLYRGVVHLSKHCLSPRFDLGLLDWSHLCRRLSGCCAWTSLRLFCGSDLDRTFLLD